MRCVHGVARACRTPARALRGLQPARNVASLRHLGAAAIFARAATHPVALTSHEDGRAGSSPIVHAGARAASSSSGSASFSSSADSVNVPPAGYHVKCFAHYAPNRVDVGRLALKAAQEWRVTFAKWQAIHGRAKAIGLSLALAH
jgi:hypothetical protein